MFFNNWQSILRVLVVGILAYGALVVMLRVSGKRTLSKMNAFDLIVTIALGSTFATVLLTKDVAAAEGLLALALLIALQWCVAWLSARSCWWRQLVKSEPRLLVLRGRLLEEALRDERVGADEVWAAMRSKGVASLENVEAVVLETDGQVSVIQAGTFDGAPAALRHLPGYSAKT